MFKIALLVWLMVGTVLAGVAMTVIVSVPSLFDQAAKLIPIGCGAGFAIGLPVAYLVALQIAAPARQ
ncbi:MAG: hypothetical protein JSS20_00080 [Proteobacteria bacterium]|nr:hypothetical protein [Pseudomonadota bacterium]